MRILVKRMKMRIQRIDISVFLLLLVALFGCKSNKVSQKKSSLTGGVLDFSDNFDRKSLGKLWTSKNPSAWKIVGNRLFVSNAHNHGLWLDRLLPPRARVEFDSEAVSKAVDMKCEIFAPKPQHETGYITILGGWHNQLSIIARKDEHGKDRLAIDRVGKENKVYHWAIVRTGSTLYWYLDGKLFMKYPDKHPILGLYFGFNDWEAPVYFDNLKIYRL